MRTPRSARHSLSDVKLRDTPCRRSRPVHWYVANLLTLLVLLSACGSAVSEGALQIVVADQTSENPPRDVVEFVVGEAATPLYPDSSRGGTPTDAGTWRAGETLTVTLWPHAADEKPLTFTINVPSDLNVGQISLVVEIEDDQIVTRAPAVGFNAVATRYNPTQAQREAEILAAEEEAKQADEEAAEAEREIYAQVLEVRREAERLNAEMRQMQTKLYEVLDEHNTVYGDDNWANFSQIARKYRTYTTEALADLHDELSNSSFSTSQVAQLNRDRRQWWSDYIKVESRAETAARNNDSTAMDAVRVEEDKLWDEWAELFDSVEALTAITAEDL